MSHTPATNGKQNTIYLTALIAVISLVLLGCQIESDSHHDQVLRTGMTMERALAMLQKEGLNPQETVEAIGRVDDQPFDLYRLDPSNGNDALYLGMMHNQEGVKVLHSMFWWINWTTESELPKGLREYNWEAVTHTTLYEIKSRLRRK